MRRITSLLVHALIASLGILFCASALAAGVYRCNVNGVATYVDSPSRCPEGGAQRQDGALVPKGTARREDPGARVQSGDRQAPAAQTAPPPGRSNCLRLAQVPTSFRECLRDERRAEVRDIATLRLKAISRAVTDHLSAASRAGSVIAVSNNGRPPAWCESILGDVMAHKDIVVVDDETVGGPGLAAAEVLDPDFREWNLAGDKIPDGYVTVRWRTSNLVALRVVAACTSADDGTARCIQQRYTSIRVYGADSPAACDVSAVGRAYWPNWKNSMTPILSASTWR